MRHAPLPATLAVALLAGFALAAAAEPAHDHGQTHKLGRKVIAGYTVSVILLGEVEPGGHVDFDIKLIGATSDPKALRVWVGTEDAKGSEKAQGKKGKATYVGEVNVPKPLPDGSKLWVELETDTGTASGSYEFEKHDDHKH
jgi:hypothetical protein